MSRQMNIQALQPITAIEANMPVLSRRQVEEFNAKFRAWEARRGLGQPVVIRGRVKQAMEAKAKR